MAGYRVKSGVTKCAHEIVPQLTREQALEQAKAFARAERDKP